MVIAHWLQILKLQANSNLDLIFRKPVSEKTYISFRNSRIKYNNDRICGGDSFKCFNSEPT